MRVITGLIVGIIGLFMLTIGIPYGCSGVHFGKSQLGVEVTGQVKKVIPIRRILYPDYTVVDVSLGVMRGGVGSMSTQDIILYVPDDKYTEILKKANKTGQLVNIRYDEYRMNTLYPEQFITSVEIEQ